MAVQTPILVINQQREKILSEVELICKTATTNKYCVWWAELLCRDLTHEWTIIRPDNGFNGLDLEKLVELSTDACQFGVEYTYYYLFSCPVS